MKPGLTWLQEAAQRKGAVRALDVPTESNQPVRGIGDCVIDPVPRLHICNPGAMARVTVVSESRQAKWKRLHPEKVREAQKLLMRKRRAARKCA